MGDNYYKINDDGSINRFSGNSNNNGRKNEPGTGFFVGLGCSIVAAGIMTAVALILNGESGKLVIVTSLFAAGFPATYVTNSLLGTLYGALFGGLSYVAYIIILAICGYVYADGNLFDTTLLLFSTIGGGFIGLACSKKD